MGKFSYSIVQRNKARGILTWYIRIYNNETKSIKYESLGTTKKGEASQLMSECISSRKYENSGSSAITFRTAVEKFIRKCNQNNLSKSTIEGYECTLRIFNPIMDDVVGDVDNETIFDLFNEEYGESANKTYNQKKVVCSLLFNFIIYDLDIQVKNPFKKLKSKKPIPKYKKTFWTLEQIKAILDQASDKKQRLFWSLMAYAGLRYFEASKVKTNDIKDGRIYVVGKGGKVAFVPIGNLLKNELDAYDDDFDFSSVRSRYSFEKAVRKAGCFEDGVNFHRLRHSFGSNLIRAGANVKAVQLLMRHSNITTTMDIYAHLLDEDLLKNVDLLK